MRIHEHTHTHLCVVRGLNGTLPLPLPLPMSPPLFFTRWFHFLDIDQVYTVQMYNFVNDAETDGVVRALVMVWYGNGVVW